jgi:hypothetical protein
MILFVVMAGLDPAMHVILAAGGRVGFELLYYYAS